MKKSILKKSVLKRCLALTIAIALVISMVNPISAEDSSIQVQMNGENLLFDVAPQMVNNRVLVPMRTIFERLGASVEWDAQTRVITATKDETVIKLPLDSRNATITKNGIEKIVELDAVPVIIEGRTLVPVRMISESLGIQVGWDQWEKSVILIDYKYFLNALKTKAANFYEFTSNQYEQVNTGEINGSGDVSFKYNSIDAPDEDIDAAVNANFNGKINEENGSIDGTIKVTGLEEILARDGLENISDISFNIRFDNNSFYVKSNLFSLLTQDMIDIGEKWIKADIAEFEIPDVKTLQDLKKSQSKQINEQVLDTLVNTPMELDVDSFAEAQALFNALLALVDDDHFKVINKEDTKVYSWNIQKQDLIDVLINIQKDSGSLADLTLEDLFEMQKFADSLLFEFNMEAEVKNNIIVSSKTALSAQADIPETGHFEVFLNSKYEVTNPNNSHFEISIPGPNDIIDFKEVMFGNFEQYSQY